MSWNTTIITKNHIIEDREKASLILVDDIQFWVPKSWIKPAPIDSGWWVHLISPPNHMFDGFNKKTRVQVSFDLDHLESRLKPQRTAYEEIIKHHA